MARGQLIAFSGLDGAGKSTQIELLLSRLNSSDVPVRLLWSRPGYTPLFSWLKTLARGFRPSSLPKAGRSSEREQIFRSRRVRRIWVTVALLDLMLYYAVWIRLLRLLGNIVVCDRYIEDARLDFQLNFPDEGVHRCFLWRSLVLLAPKPNAAFLLLVPAEESMRRSTQKNEPFPDTLEIMQARSEFFRKLAGKAEWFILDGLRARDAIHEEICGKCGLAV